MEKFKIELKWGIISAIVFFGWLMVEKTTGFHDAKLRFQPFFGILFIFPHVITYYLALKDKKTNSYSNHVTWQQSFISGIIITVIFAFLTPMILYLFYHILNPDFFKNAVNQLIASDIKKKDFAENYYNLESYIYTTIFNLLSTGIVIAATISYFLKTKKS